MPTFNNVKTLASDVIWQQGDRTIWKVSLEVNGQQMEAKTYSKAIAQVGWAGNIESYEKTGARGSETFVKQPQKEGFGGGGGGGSYSGGGKKSTPDNPHTMYLSYAKDIAVALIAANKWSDETFQSIVSAVEAGGTQLFDSRPGATPTASLPVDGGKAEASQPVPFDPFEGMGL